MFFYNFESIENFIDNNFIDKVKNELTQNKSLINLYNEKKNFFNKLSTCFVENTFNTNNNSNDILVYTSTSIKKCFTQLENINRILEDLQNYLNTIFALYDNNLENNYDEIKATLIEYNQKRDGLSQKIIEFEHAINLILCNNLELCTIENKELYIEEQNLPKVDNFNSDSRDNNCLIISEKDQKAYLPYSYNYIIEILNKSNGKFKDLQDVINSLYILPLSRFQNASISRFRESFYLVRNKENGSIVKALDLALELMFKHELNPIIIAACKNLDELDIYLDCLDEKILDQFNCFQIKFEISPKINNTFIQ